MAATAVRRIVVTRRLPAPVLQRLAAGLWPVSSASSHTLPPSPHLALSVWTL